MQTIPNQTILIVEDSPEDYAMIIRGFKKAGMANALHHCENGDEALDFLFHRGPYAPPNDPPVPGLVLLDLNLPGTDGHEVLAEIKNNPDLKKIPVIVLTTSSDERDIEKSYKAGANSYITKPVTFSGFTEAIQRLKDYWFNIAILPKGE